MIADQSSTVHSGVAQRAIDGNTSGNWDDLSCSHTVSGPQWWRLDMKKMYRIQMVTQFILYPVLSVF